MQFKFLPEDFKVTEIIDFRDEGKGKYYYYWLTKRGLSNSEVEKVFREKGLKIFFSGVKDKQALTQQLVCLQEKIPEIKEDNYFLEFVGQAEKKLFIGMHKANEFEIVLRDLNEKEIVLLKKFLREAKKKDFPNYFDEQRFGSKEFSQTLGRHLRSKNYEKALKTFLVSSGKRFSEAIAKNWGKWEEIIEVLPSNLVEKRSVFVHLLHNPLMFKEAFDFVEQRLLKRFLKQFQSFQFNEELKNQIAKNNSKQKFIKVLDESFPIIVSKKSVKRFLLVKGFPEFGLQDLKRQTCFKVEKLKLLKIDGDEFFSGKKKVIIFFVLKKGCYAMIFLKYLQAMLN